MIRNKLFSFTKAKALSVVCLVTMIFLLPLQAQDSSPKVLQFEGKLTFHQDIPVGLVSGTAEHPKLVEIIGYTGDTLITVPTKLYSSDPYPYHALYTFNTTPKVWISLVVVAGLLAGLFASFLQYLFTL